MASYINIVTRASIKPYKPPKDHRVRTLRYQIHFQLQNKLDDTRHNSRVAAIEAATSHNIPYRLSHCKINMFHYANQTLESVSCLLQTAVTEINSIYFIWETIQLSTHQNFLEELNWKSWDIQSHTPFTVFFIINAEMQEIKRLLFHDSGCV